MPSNDRQEAKLILNALAKELEDIEQKFYSVGYELSYRIFSGYWPSIVIESTDDLLPIIESKTQYAKETGAYTFDLTLTFPVIELSGVQRDINLRDITEGWNDVADIVTELQNIEFRPDDYR